MRDTVLSVSVKVFNTSDSFGWVDMAALSKDALLTSSKITDTLSTHDVKLQSHAWTLLICKLRTGPTLRGKSLKKEKPESNHVWRFHSSTCWFCMEKASLSTVASPSAFPPSLRWPWQTARPLTVPAKTQTQSLTAGRPMSTWPTWGPSRGWCSQVKTRGKWYGHLWNHKTRSSWFVIQSGFLSYRSKNTFTQGSQVKVLFTW